MIRVNPLLSKDELGLVSEFGLTYIEPDPVAHVVFPDGETFTMWLDVERTIEEIIDSPPPTPSPTGGCSMSSTR